MKNHLRMEDPHQVNGRQAWLTGQRLCSNQDIDFFSLKPSEEGVLFLFSSRFFGSENLDPVLGKRRHQLLRYGLNSGALPEAQTASAARTVQHGRDGAAAGMADQLSLLFMVGQGKVAAGAARDVPTPPADEIGGIAAAVDKQDDLLSPLQSLLDSSFQPGIDQARGPAEIEQYHFCCGRLPPEVDKEAALSGRVE